MDNIIVTNYGTITNYQAGETNLKLVKNTIYNKKINYLTIYNLYKYI